MRVSTNRVAWCMMLISVIILVICKVSSTSAAQVVDYEKRSPFEALKYSERAVFVHVDGSWYTLLAIDEIPISQIMEFCTNTYGDNAKKRFSEDLVQVLSQMNHPPGKTVDLKVRGLASKKIVDLFNVPMTEKNRAAILQINRSGARKPLKREVMITRAQAKEDITTLQTALEDQYSYLNLHNIDYIADLDSLRQSLAERVNVAEFAITIQKFLARFGDGHTRVTRSHDYLPTGYLPVDVGMADGRVVAFDPEQHTYLRDDAPYLVTIDGIEINRWLDEAGALVADGSPSLQQSGAIHRLKYLNWLRGELDVPITDVPITKEVTLQLGGRLHTGLETVTLPVAENPVAAQEDTRSRFGSTGGRLFLLRLPSFSTRLDPVHVEHCIKAMTKARFSSGLIIDVRGNGGGGRRALRYLLPYFMNEDEPPIVVNTAKFRLSAMFDDDHLANRFLHRADAEHWTDAERAAIVEFAEAFKPQWTPAADQFSDWHYMAIRRSAHKDVYHYDQPVVILMDRECFSATDIFLSAFKGRPGVTLIGTPSSGGSGKTEMVRLPNSHIRVAMSSMASFQPNGLLFDGNGIAPDIVVEPVASDVIGRTDSQMAAALKFLNEQAELKHSSQGDLK